MLVETCGKKSIYLPDSWSIQESRILQQTQGAQHIKKCWSQWAKPRYHLSSSVFCSLWTARVTKPLGNTPLWLLHLQLFFSDMKKSSIKPSSTMVDCQTVDERKSHCPEAEDINPSSPFPQLSPRVWPVKRLLPPKKAVSAHSGPTAEAVMGQFWLLPLFSPVIGNERSWHRSVWKPYFCWCHCQFSALQHLLKPPSYLAIIPHTNPPHSREGII